MHLIATVKVNKLPYTVALAKNDSLIFVTNQEDGNVSVIDTKTLNVIKEITVGDKPEGISIHSDDVHVYVANWFDNTVSVIDANTLNVVETIKTGSGSRAFGQFFSR
jgi:YVTN family beta-propeller protein